MKIRSATLVAAFLTLSLIEISSAQEPKESPQKSSTQSTKARTKGEVELKYEELKNRGDEVIVFDGGSKSSKNNIPKEAVNGNAIELVTPNYPAVARAAHVSGLVVVLVIIDPSGKVIAAQPAQGDSLLHAAALKAARESRFKPTLVKDKPVNVLGKIFYNFVPL